jgi:hypothetical protein
MDEHLAAARQAAKATLQAQGFLDGLTEQESSMMADFLVGFWLYQHAPYEHDPSSDTQAMLDQLAQPLIEIADGEPAEDWPILE